MEEKKEKRLNQGNKDDANGLWGIAFFFLKENSLEKCFFVNGFQIVFRRSLKTFAQSGNLLL